jgi:hypothetical protein
MKTITETVRITRNPDPSNPREDADYLGQIICFHGRYRLCDKHQWRTPEEFHASAEFRNAIVKLPLYLYDHSGITMSTAPFSCPWDSGQVGYIICTMARYKMMTGRKAINKALKDRLVQSLQNEVKEYDHYLTGEVYDLEILEDGEVTDSVGGFYGTEWEKNGLMGYVPNHLRNKDLWEIE